ncbi:MAG: LemA family protein [Candidatus Aminicenantaceae bacterium]
MEALYILIGLTVLILIWIISIYNSLVRLRQHLKDSWAGIETELRRRYDLIPNLVATVKGYVAHEKQVFETVTEARTRAVSSSGSPASQAADENVLVQGLRSLFAVSEGYPELKASENFLELQRELANTEDRIQAARRFYNGNVRDLNTRIEVFPSNLIANLFRFTQAEYFEIEEVGVADVPKVDLAGERDPGSE